VTLAALTYLALLIHPDPLFAHTLRGSFITAHADEPLPAAMRGTLALAESHVRTSPLFDPSREHHAYFCQSRWRWDVLSGWNHRAAAVALAPLGRAVFFRPARLASNRMIGASGREVRGERTLDYYVAHEVTHTLTADYLGAGIHALPVWVREGYADYVGRHDTFDYERVRRQLIEAAPETDPASGHYLRYVLLVAHELEREHVSVDTLLRHPRPMADVETDVRAGEGPSAAAR
jgi:hypothetical protein